MAIGMPWLFARCSEIARPIHSDNGTANQTKSIVEITVVLVESAVLQDGDSLAQCLLEFKYARMLLIETFSLLNALDVSAERFSQIDGGEYLHKRTYDVPILRLHSEGLVGDIRHSGF